MQSIPMSTFVDFMLVAGTSRLAAARQLKNDEPPTDFYKPAREAIVDMHEKGVGADVLDELVVGQRTPRDLRVFPRVIGGYRKFLRSGTMTWFEPPMRDWPLGPLAVRIAPELGLMIGGRPHAIQLYFRAEPPVADYIRLTTSALNGALARTWPGTVFALLDVRRARLYPHRPDKDVGPLLRAEAAALSRLLGSL
jgi:hypothetical protein